jgi:hypothetical protein
MKKRRVAIHSALPSAVSADIEPGCVHHAHRRITGGPLLDKMIPEPCPLMDENDNANASVNNEASLPLLLPTTTTMFPC